jgi:hypothetical protein
VFWRLAAQISTVFLPNKIPKAIYILHSDRIINKNWKNFTNSEKNFKKNNQNM